MNQPRIPHVAFVDLFDNGIGYEIVVLKHDKGNGDLYYIQTGQLDEIDFERVSKMLQRRDAGRLEAWDLFSNVTLGNGMNALVYFHQYVMVKTASGQHMRPNERRRGTGQLAPKLLKSSSFAEQTHNSAKAPQAGGEEVLSEQVRRPGRPPKADKA